MADEHNVEEPLTQTDKLTYAIASALAPIIRRAVHPETTYRVDGGYLKGWDIPKHMLVRPGFAEKHGNKPLPPRDRIAARLTLMLALSHARAALLKEIKEDQEAIDDAKAHALTTGDADLVELLR